MIWDAAMSCQNCLDPVEKWKSTLPSFLVQYFISQQSNCNMLSLNHCDYGCLSYSGVNQWMKQIVRKTLRFIG